MERILCATESQRALLPVWAIHHFGHRVTLRARITCVVLTFVELCGLVLSTGYILKLVKLLEASRKVSLSG